MLGGGRVLHILYSIQLFPESSAHVPYVAVWVMCRWVGLSPGKPSHLHKCAEHSSETSWCQIAAILPAHSSGGQSWCGLVVLSWAVHLWACLSHRCLSWSYPHSLSSSEGWWRLLHKRTLAQHSETGIVGAHKPFLSSGMWASSPQD